MSFQYLLQLCREAIDILSAPQKLTFPKSSIPMESDQRSMALIFQSGEQNPKTVCLFALVTSKGATVCPWWSNRLLSASGVVSLLLAISSALAQPAIQVTPAVGSLPPLTPSPSLSTQERWVCPMHPEVVGVQGGICPKCGMPLERATGPEVPGAAVRRAQKTIEAKIRVEEPLEVGKPEKVELSLRDKVTGRPITLEMLREVHTQKIHLLIIDHSLSDYHHEHPTPVTAESGDYVFTFTPLKPGPYRVWADLQPWSTNLQEYAVADIPADSVGQPVTENQPKLQAEAGGLRFEMTLSPAEPQMLQIISVTVRIYDAEGKPFGQLEPIMGAFAHLVGFYADRQNVVHIHPGGKPPLLPTDRSGPELHFQFGVNRPGFIRLFCQVQVDGKSIFAPFNVMVADGAPKPQPP